VVGIKLTETVGKAIDIEVASIEAKVSTINWARVFSRQYRTSDSLTGRTLRSPSLRSYPVQLAAQMKKLKRSGPIVHLSRFALSRRSEPKTCPPSEDRGQV
jgi:hypothetical protein